MKYRRLNPEEREALREEFVQFLAANSITAPDWEKLKVSHPETCEKLLDTFSDIIWEQVLSKTNFVEVRQAKVLRVMKFGDSRAEMIQIAIKHLDFDFRKPEDMRSLAEGNIAFSTLQPEIHRGRKTYTTSRNEEVFYHIVRGGIVSDEQRWELLASFTDPKKPFSKGFSAN